MKPLVSIIIPCFNQGTFLVYALQSLLAQTINEWECIIIDDGSMDNSAEVAASYCRNDKRFHLIQQPNSGSAVARNKGLSVAEGEYIQFLDADDLLNSDKLRLQSEYMTANKIDVSYTLNAYFHSMKELGEYYLQPKKQFRYYTNIRNALLSRWGISFSIPMHCFMFRRQFLEEHTIRFDERIRQREDWKLHLDVSRFCKKPALLDFIGSYYRINPTSKTSSYTKMANGNMLLLHHIRPIISITEYPLLAYRLSSEISQITIHAIRYRTCKELRFITMFFNSAGDLSLLLMAIILSPVTFIMNLIRRIA